MPKTNYLENAILDHVIKGTAMTQPANIYISLHTSSPGEDGSLTAEIVGGGYTRRLHNNWLAASGGVKKNSGAVTFPQATGDWGIITHVGINTAVSGGNMLYYGEITVPKEILTNDTLEFPDQIIEISEE